MSNPDNPTLRSHIEAAAPEGETAEQRQQRLQNITGFAGFLMPQLVGAVQEHDMRWHDVVFSVGMALRGFAEVGAMMLKNADESPMYTPEQAIAKVQALVNHALQTPVKTVRLENQAEADAFFAAQEHGLH